VGKDYWISFAVADLEQIEELSCGSVRLPLRKLADAPYGRGHRTVYVFSSPWGIAGPVHARVLRADGSTATDELPNVSDLKASNALFHLCH
jgi:hypothetical protein